MVKEIMKYLAPIITSALVTAGAYNIKIGYEKKDSQQKIGKQIQGGPVQPIALDRPLGRDYLIERLLKAHPNIIAGMKDSSGDWQNTQAMLRQWRQSRQQPGSGSNDSECLRQSPQK